MIKACYRKKILSFKRPAGTSRGMLTYKPSWYLFLSDDTMPGVRGIGECSIIPGLNPETEEMVDRKINELCMEINRNGRIEKGGLTGYPSLAFGIDTAFTDLMTGGKRILFPSSFTEGMSSVRINGLIWMDTAEHMSGQIQEKLGQGFYCLKVKIGALRIEEELQILKSIRKNFKASDLELRVDANGAFTFEEAMEIMKRLADLDVHSVEQPIKPGHWEEMAQLCRYAPVPVALDEELLEKDAEEEKQWLVTHLKPQYLVLKPGLLGGFQQAMEYIRLAEKEKTGWWITSALESNIGLNAIAQWAFLHGGPLAQGLGTGKLYHENVSCPLLLKGDRLYFKPANTWDLSFIES